MSNSHERFSTINHWHISGLSLAGSYYEILVVECRNGKFYVEDWLGDVPGYPDIWQPNKSGPDQDEPHFFDSYEECLKHAVKTIAKVAGIPEDKVSIPEDD